MNSHIEKECPRMDFEYVRKPKINLIFFNSHNLDSMMSGRVRSIHFGVIHSICVEVRLISVISFGFRSKRKPMMAFTHCLRLILTSGVRRQERAQGHNPKSSRKLIQESKSEFRKVGLSQQARCLSDMDPMLGRDHASVITMVMTRIGED